MTSETSSGATPACSRAATIAVRPSSCAGVEAKAPRNDPTGVRLAAVMTTSVMDGLLDFKVEAPLAAWRYAEKPIGQRLPNRLAGIAADDHADMALVEFQSLANPCGACRRNDAVLARDDVQDRAG